MKALFKRLIPAAYASAMVAALAHIIFLTVLSGIIGFEFFYIGALTFSIVFVVSLPAGTLLLAMIGHFKPNLISSLLVFMVVAQGVAVALIMVLFESDLSKLPWEYACISVPTTFAAWYFSVYQVWKREARLAECRQDPDNFL